MVHFDVIWNDFELQRKKKTEDAKWYILAIFETIWNCRDNFDTRTLSRALLDTFWNDI